jgi:hypothetical protein
MPYWPVTPRHRVLQSGSTRAKHTLDHSRGFDNDSGNVPVVNVVYVSKILIVFSTGSVAILYLSVFQGAGA